MSSRARDERIRQSTLDKLEAATGHSFEDLERLDRALTHSSARHRTGRDYERLEFLGDRVLGLCIAELLFTEFQSADEGELSLRLNQLVNAETLAEVAEELSLAEHIRTGGDVRQLRAGHQRNMRADVVEALIATIYLDGGLEAVRPFIVRYWKKRAGHAAAARRDPKTALQEWAHKNHAVTPTYEVVSREGPDHDPVFTVSVLVGKLEAVTAHGGSKRVAEQAAAEKMLYREKVWE